AANLKISSTTTIDPNAATIVSPGAPEDAVCIAALPDQANSSASVDAAEVAPHVVRRACDYLRAATASRLPAPTGISTATSSTDLEVGSATAVNPNSLPVVAPGAPKIAGRVTSFADELHSSACVRRTPVAPPIIRRTVDVVAVVPSAPVWVCADLKVRPTAAIDPDSSPVIAPRTPEHTGRIAALADELDSTGGVDRTVVASHIVGGACNDLSLRRRDRCDRVRRHTNSQQNRDHS